MLIEEIREVTRRVRRLLDRSEWSGRLLGLPPTEVASDKPGLLIIQLDGVGHDVLEEAIASGAMPFTAHLLADEGYRLRHLYSGMPSSTPAVQAELFYGVPQVVPAFSYVDDDGGHLVHMWQRGPVTAVEEELADQRSLLEGGGSYANVFTGRAYQARFCMASLEWSDPFRTRHPAAVPGLAVLHAWDILRTGALVGRELALAGRDLATGTVRGQHLVSEMKFAWSRTLVAVGLRELSSIGAAIDLARGLPAIHVNMLGYDETSHRRGPRSPIAFHALTDIDRAVARLTRAAWRSRRREYEVWVMSDHGQEDTDPYLETEGRTVQDAVREVLGGRGTDGGGVAEPARGVQGQRARVLGQRAVGMLVPGLETTERPAEDEVAVTAQGPIGHVYLPRPFRDADERDAAAHALVVEARIPLVLAPDGDGGADAWTEAGRRRLPDDRADLLGADHPYLDDVARDLVSLCQHRHAGDLTISGWRADGPPVSFPHENGAHGGPGPHETDAFVLAPGHTPLEPEPGAPLRPADLRRAGLALLDRPHHPLPHHRSTTPAEARRARAVRVMTYNVHSCVGLDGRLSPERIARVIARHDPDIVALQEIDVGRPRTGGVDQAAHLAELLEMMLHFHPTLQVEEERYGDAVLSRLPMRVVRAGQLPQRPSLEPRGALWVEIDIGGRPLQFINTHLSLHPLERRLQVDALLGPDWLGAALTESEVVVCGDFNALPWFPVGRRLRCRLDDAVSSVIGDRPRSTWAGWFPLGRIDHVFVDPSIEVRNVEVAAHALARVASDHLPLIADLDLP